MAAAQLKTWTPEQLAKLGEMVKKQPPVFRPSVVINFISVVLVLSGLTPAAELEGSGVVAVT